MASAARPPFFINMRIIRITMASLLILVLLLLALSMAAHHGMGILAG